MDLVTRTLIATSKNRKLVYIDSNKTNVTLHIDEQPELLKYVISAIEQSDLVEDKEVIERDFERVIGTTSLVETNENDEIIFAKRIQRGTYMRFVKCKEAIPTQKVSVILYRIGEKYDLWSAWIGPLVPTTPGGDTEMPASREFWNTHALVYDEAIIQTATVTTDSPW